MLSLPTLLTLVTLVTLPLRPPEARPNPSALLPTPNMAAAAPLEAPCCVPSADEVADDAADETIDEVPELPVRPRARIPPLEWPWVALPGGGGENMIKKNERRDL